MGHLPPPTPEPMPQHPTAWRRFREGMRSSLGLFKAGAFLSPGVGKHPLPKVAGSTSRCAYTVREPHLLREIMVERADAFPKSDLVNDMLGSLVGDSIFIANGETWRWRRAIIDPALVNARVTAVFERMRDAADAELPRLETLSRRGPVMIDDEMTRFAADVIFRTIFSEPANERDGREVMRAFETFQKVAYANGILTQLGVPKWLLPGTLIKAWSGYRIRRTLKKPLDRRLDAIRAGRPTPTDDIAASLIEGVDAKTGRRFNDKELLDEVSMLYLAGHETSASALGWSLYLLATHPHIQDRVLEEAERVYGDARPEFSHMKRLSLTRNVFREAMRLYPPVAVLTRDNVCPEHMADREIDPGSVLFVTPWVMHRQPRFWKNADQFDPDRFDSEDEKDSVRQVYMPFSVGPRVCPGAAFALQEGALMISMLVRRFRLEPLDDHVPDPVARLTLRSANGVKLKLTPRADAP